MKKNRIHLKIAVAKAGQTVTNIDTCGKQVRVSIENVLYVKDLNNSFLSQKNRITKN